MTNIFPKSSFLKANADKLPNKQCVCCGSNSFLVFQASLRTVPTCTNRPFSRYDGHFDFYCFNSYYGMPRRQIHFSLPPEHAIMSFETIEIKMAAISAKRSIQRYFCTVYEYAGKADVNKHYVLKSRKKIGGNYMYTFFIDN